MRTTTLENPSGAFDEKPHTAPTKKISWKFNDTIPSFKVTNHKTMHVRLQPVKVSGVLSYKVPREYRHVRLNMREAFHFPGN